MCMFFYLILCLFSVCFLDTWGSNQFGPQCPHFFHWVSYAQFYPFFWKGGYFGAFLGNDVPKVACSACTVQGFPQTLPQASIHLFAPQVSHQCYNHCL